MGEALSDFPFRANSLSADFLPAHILVKLILLFHYYLYRSLLRRFVLLTTICFIWITLNLDLSHLGQWTWWAYSFKRR